MTSMTQTERRPTVAWVDAMTARREARHGSKAIRQYRHRLLKRHGLPTTKRDQQRLAEATAAGGGERKPPMVGWEYPRIGPKQTGRSDRGNLRNFPAMGTQKFSDVWFAVVVLEHNDAEAIEAIEAELERRGLAA